jgi:hypothetical protein
VAGRGMLLDTGLVCTWPESDFDHPTIIGVLAARHGELGSPLRFRIRHDGVVFLPVNLDRQRTRRLIAAIRAADKRLVGEETEAESGDAARAAGVREREAWALWQARGRTAYAY